MMLTGLKFWVIMNLICVISDLMNCRWRNVERDVLHHES